MVAKTQHASKVEDGARSIQPYKPLQDRISHDDVCCPSRAKIHPGSGLITTALKFKESVKSFLKSTLGGQFQTMVIGRSPKRNEIDTIQRNSGSPKGGNSYR